MSQDSGASAPHRPRLPRNSLDRTAILAAALEIARAEGLAAVTVRRLAATLGAAPMSLYAHLPGRDELVDLLLDGVLASVGFIDEPSRPWEAELLRYAELLLDALEREPWAVAALTSRPDPGPAGRVLGEQVFLAARRGGADADAVVALFSAILAFGYGWAAFRAQLAPGVDAMSRDDIERGILAVDGATHPATAELAAELAAFGSRAHYRRAVVALITGVPQGADHGQRSQFLPETELEPR